MSDTRLGSNFETGLACLSVEGEDDDPAIISSTSDNLAVAIASYFDGHMEKPDTDEVDDETGWHPWVMEKSNQFLERLGRAAEQIHNERTQQLRQANEKLERMRSELIKENNILQQKVTDLRRIKFADFADDECWIYQEGEDNRLDGLVCPVVISAETLKQIERDNAELRKEKQRLICGLNDISDGTEEEPQRLAGRLIADNGD